ncbi:MAG TPA: DUF1579 family protein [Candidatus Acidoferrales bacterium]|nr:DUF1579 family protein [Candidatus Acidoferrales bacterium]
MKTIVPSVRNKFVFTIVAVLIISGKPFAQMAKPTFGPELARLSFVTGHFNTQIRLMMGNNTANGTGTNEAYWGLDSMFVFYSSEETVAALGSYKGFGILGYDSQNGRYVLSMFNNYGDSPVYKGNFVGDTLTMTSKIETPQGPFDQKLKWFNDGNNVRLLIFNDFGQGYTLIVDQTAVPSPKSKNGDQRR